ncbi:class I SAM-dependent methyltransferase [Pseudonocardia sp. RS010]|uniref:class I SAM-dependent methyltransferase n=1 Tax=Pseudonocardia sp. RS010 TaxID=3385979 RepID=UPI0039A0AD4D
MSGTETSAPETVPPAADTVLPATDTALDQPARAFDRIVRTSDAYRGQLRTTIHRMGLSGRKRTLLVLGCGSGAPVQGVVDEAPGWKVVAVDESAELVGTARRLDWAPDYRFLHGTLGTLDDALHAEGIEPPFDAALVVFQMRHQRNLDDTLDYLLELLKPGAPLAVHEYSVRGDRAARLRWTAACWLNYLPRIRMRGRVPGMASFLWQSVLRFDSARTFKERLEVAGFTDVRVQTVGGWQEHILHTFLGRKAEDEVDEPIDDLDAGDGGPDSWADEGTDAPLAPRARPAPPAPRARPAPPASSVPAPPSQADRPEWGPVPRADPADGADVFDLDEEEAGYEVPDGDAGAAPAEDPDEPTSYADLDEFADNHDLDGTRYLDDPDEAVLFTHADPDAETPPAGMPVTGTEVPPERAAAEPPEEPSPEAGEESREGAATGQGAAMSPAEADPAAWTEVTEAPTVAEDADAGRTAGDEPEPEPVEPAAAPTKGRRRNLIRIPRRTSAPAEAPGSPWLRRAEREAVRSTDEE